MGHVCDVSLNLFHETLIGRRNESEKFIVGMSHNHSHSHASCVIPKFCTNAVAVCKLFFLALGA